MADDESTLDKIRREAKERIQALKERRDNAPPLPTFRSLCLDQTLYAPIQINPDRDDNFITHLRYKHVQFDAHCVYCGQGATFRTMTDRVGGEFEQAERVAGFNEPAKDRFKRLKFEGGQFALHLGCSRNPSHLYSYFFSYDDAQSVLTKVGQLPSLEDVAGVDIERYRRILGNDFSELRRATGLFAHGIGIGSFVYLRRLFENLVETARIAADPNGEREAEFLAMRMSDRVKALADHLPPAVVKYKDAYGILSQGLHELTEVECRKYFPVVRAAIIAMLEQRYEAAEKAKATAELDRAVAAILAETKGT